MQATIYAHPAAVSSAVLRRVLCCGVQISRLDVQRDPPPAIYPGDGRVQDPSPTVRDHPAHLASVVTHLDGPDPRQGHRTWPVFPDPDRGTLARLGLQHPASHAERAALGLLPLEPRVPDRCARTFTATGVGPGLQGLAEVDNGFLKDLRGHFRPPRQSGHLDVGVPGAVDDDPASGCLGPLPRIERVDQVEPRPWHRDRV